MWEAHGTGLAAAAGSGLLYAGSAVGLLATSAWLVARASERPPVLALSVAVGAVQAFALARGLGRYAERLSVHGVSLRTLVRLRLWLYDVLVPLVPGGLQRYGGGRVLAGFASDAEVLATGQARGIAAAVEIASALSAGAVVAILVQPAVGLVLLGGAGVTVGVCIAASAAGRTAGIRESASRAELAGVVMETMRAAPEMLVYGRRDLIDRRLREVRCRSAAAALRGAFATGIAMASATWVAGASLVAVLTAGFAVHRAGGLDGVMLAVEIFVALAVLYQCMELPGALAATRPAAAAAVRLAELGQLEPPAPEPEAGPVLPSGPVSAAFRNVTVMPGGAHASDLSPPFPSPSPSPSPVPGARAPGDPILDNVSFGIAPASRVLLTGPSGSGKTTLLYVLLHFLEPDGGRAELALGKPARAEPPPGNRVAACAVPGSNPPEGIDVRLMPRGELARHIGWMGEATYVFASSLAANLRIARPDASDAECLEVLFRTGLGSWYRSLACGLDTLLGAGGRPMSTGESQRLGMARMLLAGGSILLLDEPAAHIDPGSAPQLVGELLSAAGSRSAVIVSHEPDLAAWPGVEPDLVVTPLHCLSFRSPGLPPPGLPPRS